MIMMAGYSTLLPGSGEDYRDMLDFADRELRVPQSQVLMIRSPATAGSREPVLIVGGGPT
jgi:hypothetical protein